MYEYFLCFYVTYSLQKMNIPKQYRHQIEINHSLGNYTQFVLNSQIVSMENKMNKNDCFNQAQNLVFNKK